MSKPGPSSYLEWSGSLQMTILLIVICLFGASFLVAWITTRPDLADAVKLLAPATDAATTQRVAPERVIELLGELQQAHFEQFRNLFQVVVLSGLVPLFTLLAGYVFGKSKNAGGGSNEDAGGP